MLYLKARVYNKFDMYTYSQVLFFPQMKIMLDVVDPYNFDMDPDPVLDPDPP